MKKKNKMSSDMGSVPDPKTEEDSRRSIRIAELYEYRGKH